MRLTDRLARIATSLRTRPRLAAATAATAGSAIVAGGILALVIGGSPQAAVAPTASPTEAAASSTPTITPTATPAPTPTSQPTASATASPTPTPTPLPTLTPTPPEGGYGGPILGPGGPFEDPVWEAMPALPNGDAHAIAGVVVLDDGRLIAFREAVDRSSWGAVSIRPGDLTWTEIPISGLETRRLYSFTLGPDGRIYTEALVIDPTAPNWTAVDAGWGEPATSHVIGSGPDDRLYRAVDGGILVILDPATGDIGRSSANDASRNPDALSFNALLPGTTEVFAVDLATVVAYDPATDSWRLVVDWGWHHAARSGIGPDGSIWIMADEEEGRVLHRLNPVSSEWVEVPRPHEAWWEWIPHFVTGPDGRVWAIGEGQVFALRADP